MYVWFAMGKLFANWAKCKYIFLLHIFVVDYIGTQWM